VSKSNWLALSEITIALPNSDQGVENLREDIEYLAQYFPDTESDYVDAFKQFPQYLTLAYHNDEPIGMIVIKDSEGEEVGKDSLTFGGCVVPKYRDRGITQQVAPAVIRRAFLSSHKRKMLADIHPDNTEAQMAISSLGFRRIGKTPEKNFLYILTRSEALGRK
jgi:RimJ/RimL family protein N-acetyltransferase